MRTIRNATFVALVVTAVFASSRGVLADWGNWEPAGAYSWTWYGGCTGAWDCDGEEGHTLYDNCANLCSLYDGVSGFDCYWSGEVAEYPDNPNCWASCDCRPFK